MRAAVAAEFGGPEVLRIVDRDSPSPGPRELVVDVAAVGVNFMDIYSREVGRRTRTSQLGEWGCCSPRSRGCAVGW